MREQLLRSVQLLTNPLFAGLLATAIVLTAVAFVASHVQRALYDIPLGVSVERVAVTKRAVVASPPASFAKLHLNVAANQSQSVAASTGLSEPQIARTAKISLYVSSVDKAVANVGRVARANAGDVFSSDISNGDAAAAQPSGDMEIRIPADRFDSAMNALMQAGTVRERSTNAQDLTGSITDSDARLRNLRRTEADIRVIMDRSGSVAQVMDAENQLSSVREQIETLESELKDMRSRVAYATIDVDLQAEAKTAPVTPSASSQLVSAWHDAVASLGALTVTLLAVLLWLIVFIPYFAAIAAIAWVISIQMRRGKAVSARR